MALGALTWAFQWILCDFGLVQHWPWGGHHGPPHCGVCGAVVTPLGPTPGLAHRSGAHFPFRLPDAHSHHVQGT